MEKTKFLEEAPGVKSFMRLASLILLIFFILFNLLLAISGDFEIDSGYISFNFILLIGIFVPKYLQKFAEVKKNGQ